MVGMMAVQMVFSLVVCWAGWKVDQMDSKWVHQRVGWKACQWVES
jgi:hypothetical protein